MLGFRKKLARIGVLAGASAAVMAVGGVGASSAVAAPACAPDSTNIVGKGATFQKVAQEFWTGREVPTNPLDEKYNPGSLPFAAGSNTGYRNACSTAGDPTVSYASTGSGAGLLAFRFTGTGNIDTRIGFIATDDAPDSTMIANAEAKSGTANPIIVPVTQTAIAVIANPPAGCTVTKITSADLNKVFAGEIKQWSGLETDSGSCNSNITRVVRSEGSGTTFQFKNYLAEIVTKAGGTNPTCKTEGVTRTWAELRPNSAGGKPNISWPECEGGVAFVGKAGNSNVAAHVQATAGTIGYAALPDAKKANAKTLELQNGTTGGGTKLYAAPEGEQAGTAACLETTYQVPVQGRVGGSGEGVDWSLAFGANPTIATPGVYPLCSLSFVAAWSNYAQAGYSSSEGKPAPANVEDVVGDYIKEYVVAGGQLGLEAAGAWYSPLPVGEETPATNVLEAAEFAASKINP